MQSWKYMVSGSDRVAMEKAVQNVSRQAMRASRFGYSSVVVALFSPLIVVVIGGILWPDTPFGIFTVALVAAMVGTAVLYSLARGMVHKAPFEGGISVGNRRVVNRIGAVEVVFLLNEVDLTQSNGCLVIRCHDAHMVLPPSFEAREELVAAIDAASNGTDSGA